MLFYTRLTNIFYLCFNINLFSLFFFGPGGNPDLFDVLVREAGQREHVRHDGAARLLVGAHPRTVTRAHSARQLCVEKYAFLSGKLFVTTIYSKL